MSIFAVKAHSNTTILLLVVCITFVIVCLEKILAIWISKFKYKEDRIVTFEYLKREGLSLSTNITNKEIDKIVEKSQIAIRHH
jgi:hypothetical protein